MNFFVLFCLPFPRGVSWPILTSTWYPYIIVHTRSIPVLYILYSVHTFRHPYIIVHTRSIPVLYILYSVHTFRYPYIIVHTCIIHVIYILYSVHTFRYPYIIVHTCIIHVIHILYSVHTFRYPYIIVHTCIIHVIYVYIQLYIRTQMQYPCTLHPVQCTVTEFKVHNFNKECQIMVGINYFCIWELCWVFT